MSRPEGSYPQKFLKPIETGSTPKRSSNVGTFATNYKFESKWDPDITTGAELKGRCQHPIATGSGTDGFTGATGRVDFKDEVSTGRYLYRGHIKLG